MPDYRIHITFNDAYFEEFFEEWVIRVGRGWRIDQVMIAVSAVAAVGLATISVVSEQRGLMAAGGVAAFAAAFEGWKRVRRRRAWLAFCRSLPWFGRELHISVVDGALIQEKPYAGDPRLVRSVPILLTPRGYLVSYLAEHPIDAPSAVSPDRASVYIPHRAVEPPVDRDTFAAIISAE
jgi:hypothetical protein